MNDIRSSKLARKLLGHLLMDQVLGNDWDLHVRMSFWAGCNCFWEGSPCGPFNITEILHRSKLITVHKTQPGACLEQACRKSRILAKEHGYYEGWSAFQATASKGPWMAYHSGEVP